jgi:hypothetical protein
MREMCPEGEWEQDEQAEGAEIQEADTRRERVPWRSVGGWHRTHPVSRGPYSAGPVHPGRRLHQRGYAEQNLAPGECLRERDLGGRAGIGSPEPARGRYEYAMAH